MTFSITTHITCMLIHCTLKFLSSMNIKHRGIFVTGTQGCIVKCDVGNRTNPPSLSLHVVALHITRN